jgi:hypothetical protein
LLEKESQGRLSSVAWRQLVLHVMRRLPDLTVYLRNSIEMVMMNLGLPPLD